MIIGARIDERIKAVGLSQSELARRVKLRQSTISGLIKGDQRSTTHLHKIARELGTTPAYLEGETDDPDANAPTPPELTHEEIEVVELLRALEPQDKQAIIRLARSLATSARSPTIHAGGGRGEAKPLS